MASHLPWETGHTAYFRGNSHIEGLRLKKSDNVMFEHHVNRHPHIPTMKFMDFKMTVTGQHIRPVLRQACEGLLISKEIEDRDRKKRV